MNKKAEIIEKARKIVSKRHPKARSYKIGDVWTIAEETDEGLFDILLESLYPYQASEVKAWIRAAGFTQINRYIDKLHPAKAYLRPKTEKKVVNRM